MSSAAAATAQLIARSSYGRLLARIAARTHDIAAAEDALAEAFVAALTQWPHAGVPQNPEGWLVATARRRIIDGHRRAAVRDRDADHVARLLEELGQATAELGELPDERLRLLRVCTHPAIDAAAQVPLMLQTVLGLEAEAIASAFRVAPKTMGQRLWRAKLKIREAGIPFDVPDRAELPERLERVLEAIYTAFGVAWEDAVGAEERSPNLVQEAIFLGRLLVALLPDEPEPRGLLALMLFAEARRPARRDAAGGYVPLPAQDPARWSGPTLAEAEALLLRAVAFRRLGPYQLEAALQSAHVQGVRTGRVDHDAIVALYDGLIALAPSLGAQVGRAAALIEARGPALAIAALDELDPERTRDYQPYWAARAEAQRALGETALAIASYQRAVGLCEEHATRRFLQQRLAELAESAELAGPT